jgi:hypothetical protein
MTEAEWLACTDPVKMLEFLHGKGSDRKLRLFACACCRRLRPLFQSEPQDWHAVLVSERHADGLATVVQLKYARQQSRSYERAAAMTSAFRAATDTVSGAELALRHLTHAAEDRDRIYLEDDQSYTAGYSPAAGRLVALQKQGQAKLLRDIFSNPFRPRQSLSPAVLGWNDSTVRGIAQTIYDEHAFERLPILGMHWGTPAATMLKSSHTAANQVNMLPDVGSSIWCSGSPERAAVAIA